MKPAAPKMAMTISERITQQKGSVVLLVSGFMSKRASEAKYGSASERLVAMNNGKVHSAAKVALGPILPSAAIDLCAEKGKSACTDSCERSTVSEAEEFPKVCELLKADLLEDVDACAKFVLVWKVVIHLDSFVKRHVYLKRSSLIATMHKTLILAAESMRID